MAATVSSTSARGKPGAWAPVSEEHEEGTQLQKHQDEEKKAYGFGGSAETEPLADFPSLSTAVVAGAKKKKKGQTLSLAEFTTTASFSAKSSSASQSQGLTPEEFVDSSNRATSAHRRGIGPDSGEDLKTTAEVIVMGIMRILETLDGVLGVSGENKRGWRFQGFAAKN
ncbi:Plant specific eukaryotic initiation factor 4B [Dillenia turbinata]|uniref:Plant specific eukaryotic initiation factor 4B n=1 Tax=Dillenia turbinata TaxID=194707 RepID=A0AAN8VBM5_9MAGN